MRIEYVGLNGYEVEPGFIEHARPRLEGLTHLTSRLRDIRVAVELQRGRYTVEITCDVDGLVFRSETTQNDQLASFDEAFDKVERQISRHKSKLVRLRKQGPHRGEEPINIEAVPPVELEEEDEELGEFSILRTKTHSLKPMSPQEAVLQMEMVGHDFYVFIDGATHQVAVVYRRRNGGFGLISPSTEEEPEE
ncbi:MAG: ribosome hibernation-promoting factor, HPF/YfiA family [Armatimonadota bacterium]